MSAKSQGGEGLAYAAVKFFYVQDKRSTTKNRILSECIQSFYVFLQREMPKLDDFEMKKI